MAASTDLPENCEGLHRGTCLALSATWTLDKRPHLKLMITLWLSPHSTAVHPLTRPSRYCTRMALTIVPHMHEYINGSVRIIQHPGFWSRRIEMQNMSGNCGASGLVRLHTSTTDLRTFSLPNRTSAQSPARHASFVLAQPSSSCIEAWKRLVTLSISPRIRTHPYKCVSPQPPVTCGFFPAKWVSACSRANEILSPASLLHDSMRVSPNQILL